MRVANDEILSISLVNTADVDHQSDPVWLGHIPLYSIQAIWTGTATGNLKLQASNDLGPTQSGFPIDSNSVTNWVDLDDSTIALGGANGSHLWIVDAASYRWVRLYVDNNDSGSGTSTIVARVNVKGF